VIVVLAGGTGGAKLARGMLDLAGDELTVIANTADDVEAYRAYVSPDPDLVTFWLADRIDERGWGLEGDTFAVMDELRALGDDVWFNLGDRDLAIGLRRARRLAEGATLTQCADELRRALGVPAQVLPMSDDPVRTRILSGGRWLGFQSFMVRERAAGPIDGVEFAGLEAARATREALDAIAAAEVVVVGPSNPVISVWPILRTPGLEEALRAAPAPVVGVSPIVAGEVVKGVTRSCLDWAGLSCDARGVAAAYGDLLDGMVADEPVEDLPVPRTDVLMAGADGRRRLAAETLAFARSLR
jgi:LPPG:FO 2-phospho-L-lactate transferase